MKKLKFFVFNAESQKGQTMLLTVLLVGAAALTLVSIAGYMTLQRLRMSSDIVDSTRAIMAADAGIECELYNFYKRYSFGQPTLNCGGGGDLSFGNNVSVITEASTTLQAAPNQSFVKAVGASNKARRAFMVAW